MRKWFGKLFCSWGFHHWDVGGDEFGVARWCKRCNRKHVLEAELGSVDGKLTAVNMRWAEDK